VQDNQALSRRRGTLRGLHYLLPPAAQGKLLRAVRGRFLDVVVDIRRVSPTILSPRDRAAPLLSEAEVFG
jgi:dTDP-4-dehydrorhamnose 3,5-epimerase